MGFHIEGTFSDEGKLFSVPLSGSPMNSVTLKVEAFNPLYWLLGKQVRLTVYDAKSQVETPIVITAKQARELLGMGAAEKHHTFFMGVGRSLAAMLHSVQKEKRLSVLDLLIERRSGYTLAMKARLECFGFDVDGLEATKTVQEFWDWLISHNSTSKVHAPKDITPQEALFLKEFRQRRNGTWTEANPVVAPLASTTRAAAPQRTSEAASTHSFIDASRRAFPEGVRVVDPNLVTEKREVKALYQALCKQRLIASDLLQEGVNQTARMKPVDGRAYALTECHCCALSQRQGLVSGRTLMVSKILKRLQEHAEKTGSKEVTFFSFASGGCFQELEIHAKLAQAGYSVTWHLIDPCFFEKPGEGQGFGSSKTADDFTLLVKNINDVAQRPNKPVVLWRSFEALFTILRKRAQDQQGNVFGEDQSVVWLACDCDLHGSFSQGSSTTITGASLAPPSPRLLSDEKLIERFPEGLPAGNGARPALIRAVLDHTDVKVDVL